MLTINAPASKSVSHRMLMGAALANGTSQVSHILMSKDIERTMAVLTAAGASFTLTGEDSFTVKGVHGRPQGAPLHQTSTAPLSCDMHESGTSCRLLTAILAAGHGRFRIHGAERLHERPIGRLASALQSLGVGIAFEQQFGCPPLRLSTQGFTAREVIIDMDESSQYLSGLLMAAPCSSQGLSIKLGGSGAVSWPYVGLTLQAMEDFGITFTVESKNQGQWQVVNWREVREAVPGALRFHVQPGAYEAGTYTVEGDWSGASYLLAAGIVGRHPLRVRGLRRHSLQGDRAMLDILQAMGAAFTWEGEDLLLTPSPLHGIDVDMSQCPDLVPTVAVLAAFAQGCTQVRNVAHLRIKESDRIAAPAAELRKVGVRVDEHEDGLTVHGLGHVPHIPQEALFNAHGDHRIAMSTALLSLHGQDVPLDDPTVVQKSFPHFWKIWEQLR